jgi:nitronate monooxygenase
MNFSSGQAGKPKAWKDIWGSGQGIGAIDQVLSTKEFVSKLHSEYIAARERLGYASNYFDQNARDTAEMFI